MTNWNNAVVAMQAVQKTATWNSGDLENGEGKSAVVIFDMTAVGTGSVTLTIQGKDVASGKYYTILAGVAVLTNITSIYRVGPGLTAAANLVANDVMPRFYRILATHNNANPADYTVGVNLVV